jgi:hypothetical protein
MSQSGRDLLTELRDLRRSITAEAAKRLPPWQGDIELASFAASASNLAHYLAFGRVAELVEIGRGGISGGMKLSYHAARSMH